MKVTKIIERGDANTLATQLRVGYNKIEGPYPLTALPNPLYRSLHGQLSKCAIPVEVVFFTRFHPLQPTVMEFGDYGFDQLSFTVDQYWECECDGDNLQLGDEACTECECERENMPDATLATIFSVLTSARTHEVIQCHEMLNNFHKAYDLPGSDARHFAQKGEKK